jgi:glycine dehydrogenase subunit 2
MYFPLIVSEALMFEPTETESKETLDEVIMIMNELFEDIKNDPDKLRLAPQTTPITRTDDVQAARHPILRYKF